MKSFYEYFQYRFIIFEIFSMTFSDELINKTFQLHKSFQYLLVDEMEKQD